MRLPFFVGLVGLLLIPACGAPVAPPATDDAAAPVDDGPACTRDPAAVAADRLACRFAAGAYPVESLCVDGATLHALRENIQYLVVITQENRSYDHYFGRLAATAASGGGGQPDSEPIPAAYTNTDRAGAHVAPFHLTSTCLPTDPPHQWIAMHDGWNKGAMDGFVKSAGVNGSDGHFTMGYYAAADLPVSYWLASTFALADHHFGAALGGTWANRDYLYTGTSSGVYDTGQAVNPARSVFDQLTEKNVSWGSYSDGNPRQDCLGWAGPTHPGFHHYSRGADNFLAALAAGTLPAVSFLDPDGPNQDQHPTNDVQAGDAWLREIYEAARQSPLWPRLAIFYTYDESGGLADHVPPPAACPPSADQAEFDNLGVRVPFLLISPWARRAFVSHAVHEHTGVLRFIQLLHGLPALTARDANAAVPLDLFDFTTPALLNAPTAPPAATGGCH